MTADGNSAENLRQEGFSFTSPYNLSGLAATLAAFIIFYMSYFGLDVEPQPIGSAVITAAIFWVVALLFFRTCSYLTRFDANIRRFEVRKVNIVISLAFISALVVIGQPHIAYVVWGAMLFVFLQLISFIGVRIYRPSKIST